MLPRIVPGFRARNRINTNPGTAPNSLGNGAKNSLKVFLYPSAEHDAKS